MSLIFKVKGFRISPLFEVPEISSHFLLKNGPRLSEAGANEYLMKDAKSADARKTSAYSLRQEWFISLPEMLSRFGPFGNARRSGSICSRVMAS